MSSIYTSGNDKYFYSNKIKVFPCAYRSVTYDATARLNTEYNFTHLPHTVDKASYIIKFDNEKLLCVIQGYYFEIELGDGDFTTLQNKYLNICVASPNGVGSIESPHLCSWNSSDSVEATLDGKPEGSDYYIFKGLKIGKGALSNGSYQCYALKLDASAKLPISANKIENSSGKPISQEFTTETLSATTSANTQSLNVASDKLIVNSSSITANVPVTINNTLDVKPVTTSVLTVVSEKVTINKPTDITGTTTIKGDTQIKKSSSGATDGNLKVEGTGNFGDKLTVTSGGVEITGATEIKGGSGNLKVAGIGEFGGKLTVTSGGAEIAGDTIISGTTGITGKATIGSGDTKTEIENDTIKTSKITIEKASNTGSLVIDKKQDNIIEIKDKSNTLIFSVNTNSGITFANKINAAVEGVSDDAKNVTDTIKGTNITDIFGSTSNKIDRLKLRIIEPDTDATWVPGADQSVKIILKKDTDPVKTKAVSFFLAKGDTATVVEADEFIGVAETAQAFNFPATIQLSGDVAGKAESKYGWTIKTTINDSAVTNDKLAGDISNDKLVNDSITIGGSSVSLGNSIGTSNNRINGTLYGASLDLLEDMSVNNIGNIKVSGAGLKSSAALQIVKSNNYDYVKISNGSSTINSLLVNGLSEFTSRATFEAGISVTGSATFGNGISVTQDTATFGAGISVTGTAEATTFNATSDKRLKENIIDYKPEKSILDLPIKKFDFIDGPKNQIGCIAQDLKEICPEIVNENEKGYLSIQESKLVYLLLDEVKKLKNEVEKLKHK